MEDSTRGTSPLLPRVGHVLRLAEIIKEVDLGNRLDPVSLAEAILAHPGFSGCHDAPAAGGFVDEFANPDDLRI